MRTRSLQVREVRILPDRTVSEGRSVAIPDARVEAQRFGVVYAMHMLNERLQILVSPEQRRRLTTEAKRRGTSVASLVREAVDARFGVVARADRLQALREVRAMRGRFLPPDALNRAGEAQRDQQLDAILRSNTR